ncbi:MAG: hypothetical protein EHM58_07965 [Ignavibacteriae bacterium]|nr:MAG: hypothetical protein EHM58_07965 [Ignavibacteriota bacterium]
MKSKTKILRLIANIELFIGFIILIITAFLYFMADRFGDKIGESTPLILLIIGIVLLIDYPILLFVARKIDEKNPSPVEY